MPINRTYRSAALVDAAEHVRDAARAEKLKPKEVEGLWIALPDAQRAGLIDHAKDAGSDGQTLADWRNAFPGAFAAELTDEQASAVIRIAVAVAGGVIQELDDTVTEVKVKRAGVS